MRTIIPNYNDIRETDAYWRGYSAGYAGEPYVTPSVNVNAYSKGHWEGSGDRREEESRKFILIVGAALLIVIIARVMLRLTN